MWKCTMLGPAVTASSQLVPLDAKNRPGGSPPSLFGLNTAELTEWMLALGQPRWRGSQVADAIYRQRFVDIEDITTLPKDLRRHIARQGWTIGRPKIVQVFTSVDGTERYLVQGQSPDGLTVETVWMPEGDGGEAGDQIGEPDGTDPGAPEADPEQSKRWDRATIC